MKHMPTFNALAAVLAAVSYGFLQPLPRQFLITTSVEKPLIHDGKQVWDARPEDTTESAFAEVQDMLANEEWRGLMAQLKKMG